MFSAWKGAEASVRPGGEHGSQPAGRHWDGLLGQRQPPPQGSGGHLLPEGPQALLQGGVHHIFILFLADGARGVDEASQGGERERVAQRPLLEGSQCSQALRARHASLGLLQLSAGHPRAATGGIQQDVLDLTVTLVRGRDRQEVLLGQLTAGDPRPGQQGSHRRQSLGILVKGKDLPLVLEKSSQVTGLIAWGSACIDDVGPRGRSQQHGRETTCLVLQDEVTGLVQWMVMQICLGRKHKQLWQQGIQEKTLPFEGPDVIEAAREYELLISHFMPHSMPGTSQALHTSPDCLLVGQKLKTAVSILTR